jgi:hypothetical protein
MPTGEAVMVVPHEPGMLALASVLVGHDAKPKIRRLCRERLANALARLARGEPAGPFTPRNPMVAHGASETIKQVCRACGQCRGV